ncbi:MAG: chemotaxis response regulator protein-glutamate methylesterase [Ruminiclostridium sp.]|nr:chemotaxis response regulator protein-glutamate methylesterase [Ruminiclostridium sp.]
MADNIRVLVVDDSPVFCKFIQQELDALQGIEVVGVAHNAEDAREKLLSLSPDVMTLDVEMPGMSGIDFLKRCLPERPIPVIVISSSETTNAFDAMSAGAIEFVRKPQGGTKVELNKFIVRIATVIRYARIVNLQPKKVAHRVAETTSTPLSIVGDPRKDIVIAIGASTGGTDALVEIFKRLPKNTPPVIVTQHMPPTFTKMFAERIDRLSPMSAKEAEDGDRLKQGQIIVAAGGLQMRLMKDARGYYVTSKPGEKVSGHCPSVDVLFSSVAEAAGANAVGVILTGMGGDGAEGLLKMRNAGAYTIGQDEETCVVYGMPAVAFKKGAVVTQLPLQKIAEQILLKVK